MMLMFSPSISAEAYQHFLPRYFNFDLVAGFYLLRSCLFVQKVQFKPSISRFVSTSYFTVKGYNIVPYFRGMRKENQGLKRISRRAQKPKPS